MFRTLIGIAVGTMLIAPGVANGSTLPFTIQAETLQNGLRVVMVPYPSPGLIAYYQLVRVGSRDEVEQGVTGFAHFFEHMMFRGTKDYPPERVMDFLKKTGADQNGFTTDDFTCYTFFGSNGALEELVKMESDRFQRLEYTEDIFKTESKAVLGEYNKSASDPMLPLEEKLRELVFKNHTYGHTTLGYLRDIQDMPNQYEYSRKFFRRFYTPDNTTIIAVGDFQPKPLLNLIQKYYGRWQSKRDVTKFQDEPAQTKEVRGTLSWKTPTLPILSISWRTPATRYDSPDTAVYNLIYELVFGKISSLYSDLVLDKQMVDSIEDGSWNHRDPYLFHAIVRLKDPKHLATVEARIDEQVAFLEKGKLDPKLLEDVKANVRYSILLRLQTPDRVASALTFSIAPTGQVDGLDKMLRSLEKLSTKDVQAFAKKYLKKSNRSVFVLTSEGATP